ncbi:hypothetical protein BH09PSE5_BH09PSE5_21540 [soil metagenome]
MRALVSIVVAVAALSLAACGEADKPKTPGQKLDAALAKAEQTGAAAKVVAEKGLADAKSAADKALKQAAEATKEPRAQAGQALSDGKITATIKARLAQDADLSALQVGVDTDFGKVKLTGSAPSESARDRATTMAKSVDGVTSVDNKLVVSPK